MTTELEPKVVLILGDFKYQSANDDVAQMEKVIGYLKPLTENNIRVSSNLEEIGSLWADESDVEKTLNSFPEDAPY